MSALAYEERYSVDDYELWEGDWELIYGDAYAKAPSPSFEHQSISMKISRQLDEALDECKKCSAVFELDVEFSDDTVVRPDVMVLCYKPKGRVTRTPEIIFEVSSKATSKRDEILKFALYEKEGVKYYNLVYPKSKKVKSYKLIEGKYRKIADFHDEHYLFELSKCSIDFDFEFIWSGL